MLASLDSNQISEWQALEHIEPYGERAAYWRSGLLCSILANIHRKSGQKAFTAEDFMPKFDQGDEDVERTGKRIAHSMQMYADYVAANPNMEVPG